MARAQRRASKGLLAWRVRVWFALEQARRRRGAVCAGDAPVPGIYAVEPVAGVTVPGLADVWVRWDLERGTWPVGSFELAWKAGAGGAEQTAGTVGGGDRAFYHGGASAGDETLFYRVRYGCECGGVSYTGAWSAWADAYVEAALAGGGGIGDEGGGLLGGEAGEVVAAESALWL